LDAPEMQRARRQELFTKLCEDLSA